jgi:hypothetical protein
MGAINIIQGGTGGTSNKQHDKRAADNNIKWSGQQTIKSWAINI